MTHRTTLRHRRRRRRRLALMLGDSCERLAEIPDESSTCRCTRRRSRQLYTYSPEPARPRQQRRPGRVLRALRLHHPRTAARHQARPDRLRPRPADHHAEGLHGVIGLTDFRGDVIRAYIDNGWIFHGEVTVDKDPQAQAIRTKATGAAVRHQEPRQLDDPAGARRLPAAVPQARRQPVPIKNDVTNEEWIEWARPVWPDIRETNTLNVRVAREDADERHICPLQLDFIERCVRLWSNPGETVLSPFAGHRLRGLRRRQARPPRLGCELKPSYWRTAVRHGVP
jgi:hypothetical protein